MPKPTKKQKPEMIVSTESYKVTVDYAKLLAEWEPLEWHYFDDPDVKARNFPFDARTPEEVEICLFRLRRSVVTTDEVFAELKKRGLRPAKIPELLSLGAARPYLQRKFYLVALGSGWRSPYGDVFVPILHGDGVGRLLTLLWGAPDWGWGSGCRLLAVRK
jgi:hypothetical protein